MALRFYPCGALPLPLHLPATVPSNPPSLLPTSPPLFSICALNRLLSHASASPDATRAVAASAVGSSTPASTASPVPPTPVFLRHLEVEAGEEDVVEDELEAVASEEKESAGEDGEEVGGQEEDGEADPILSFFESKLSAPDPRHEGRTYLQKNRRTSWRIADFVDASAEEDELEEVEFGGLELGGGGGEAPSSTAEDGGVLSEILTRARDIPENSTLGELLGPFAGKVGKGECVRLLVRMGEEGLVSECLYLFEWMGLQAPSLVTPRACSVLFPVLGRAGKGKQLMTLLENLSRTKRFRDVHVYNAAISGLACCGR